MRNVATGIENIYFNKAECGVDFLINTDAGESLSHYYFGNKTYITDFFEIIFFKEAGGKIFVSNSGYDVPANSVVFISPYQQHQFRITADSKTFRFLIFKEDFLLDFLSDKYFTYRLHYNYKSTYPPVITVSEERMRRYFDVLDEIRDELQHPLTNAEPILRSLLYYLLSQLNRQFAETYNLPSVKIDNTLAYRFKELIGKNLIGKQRVSDYAEELGVSRITLNTAVKTQFGVTATTLLKNRLINEIKNSLLQPNGNVKEIAYKYGFSEPSHLMRFFKSQTGQTISDYLNEYSLDLTPYQIVRSENSQK